MYNRGAIQRHRIAVEYVAAIAKPEAVNDDRGLLIKSIYSCSSHCQIAQMLCKTYSCHMVNVLSS